MTGEEDIIKQLVAILDAYEGRINLMSNQGQALGGYTALANFVEVAKRARDAVTIITSKENK